MIKPRTQARLIRLSLWQPPPGVTRMHVIADDGTIHVHLETDRFQESLLVCPCCSTEGVYDLLEEIAVGLLNLERAAGRADREAEARVERRLASADKAFRAGLKRATRKGRRP